MGSVLLLRAMVIIIYIVTSHLPQHLGVPALPLFLALGMLLGSDGLFRIPFDNFGAAERICSVTLIFIMFHGGFGTRWETARSAAARTVVLSTLSATVIALFTALFYHFALGFSIPESFLTGAAISSADTASVFSILHSKKPDLRNRTASLLEVESGSNDPVSYMLAVIALSLMGMGGGGAIPWVILVRVVFGLGLGVAVAGLSILVLRRLTFSGGLDTIFVVITVLLFFVLLAVAGGNSYLGAYLAGILIGNAKVPHKAALVRSFDRLTSLTQTLVSSLLGLLSLPQQLSAAFLPTSATTVLLTFMARLAAAFLLLAPFRCGVWQCLLVSWAELRGAASIAFTIMAVTGEVAIGYDFSHIVFYVTLLLVVVQGSLLPLVVRELDVVDSVESVNRISNDYQDQRQLHLARFPIGVNHPWAGWTIREYELLADALMVMFRWGNENVIPNGDTAIQAGNLMVLSTLLYEDDDGVNLREMPVAEHRDWVGGSIKELGIPTEVLIALACCANDTTVVPRGRTVLQQGDMLVVNEWEEA